ncbi:unnamed protein product, partial [Polarella glacialis]
AVDGEATGPFPFPKADLPPPLTSLRILEHAPIATRQAFGDWLSLFRNAAPYIASFRGGTVVVHVPSFLLDDDRHSDFKGLMEDVAFCSLLGLKMVLVSSIENRLLRRILDSKSSVSQLGMKVGNSLRDIVIDEQAIQFAKQEAGFARVEVESSLSAGFEKRSPSQSNPTASAGLFPVRGAVSVISSTNFFSASPMGIRGGVDCKYAGVVRSVNVDLLTRQLQEGDIVSITPLGSSPSGEVFFVPSEQLAAQVATKLQAIKLVYITSGQTLMDDRNGRVMAGMQVHDARAFLKYLDEGGAETYPKEDQESEWFQEFVRYLRLLVASVSPKGVRRGHLVDPAPGLLLQEFYTTDGSGTCVAQDLYQGLGRAKIADAGPIWELLFEDAQSRGGATPEVTEIEVSCAGGEFFVWRRDEVILGCGQLVAHTSPKGADGRGNELVAELRHLAASEDAFTLNAPALFAYAERAAVLGGASMLVAQGSQEGCCLAGKIAMLHLAQGKIAMLHFAQGYLDLVPLHGVPCVMCSWMHLCHKSLLKSVLATADVAKQPLQDLEQECNLMRRCCLAGKIAMLHFAQGYLDLVPLHGVLCVMCSWMHLSHKSLLKSILATADVAKQPLQDLGQECNLMRRCCLAGKIAMLHFAQGYLDLVPLHGVLLCVTGLPPGVRERGGETSSSDRALGVKALLGPRSRRRDFGAGGASARDWEHVVEHPAVGSRTPAQVEDWRTQNSVLILEGWSVPKPVLAFEEAGFPDWAVEVLRSQRLKEPTAVQAQTWPLVALGRDVVAIAETGVGKTLAYAVPLLVRAAHAAHLVAQRRQRPWQERASTQPAGLIVVPTLELAAQVRAVLLPLAVAGNVRVVDSFNGGRACGHETLLDPELESSVVVTTPSRLAQWLSISVADEDEEDLIRQLPMIVIDEADAVIESDQAALLSALPGRRQLLLFSATWPDSAAKLAERHLQPETVLLHVGAPGGLTACRSVIQHFEVCAALAKPQMLLSALKCCSERPGTVLVFCNSNETVEEVLSMLREQEDSSLSGAQGIHSGMTQAERTALLEELGSGKGPPLLVATSLVGRGHDFPKVKLVLNYDMPPTLVEYIHRVGRCGRMGGRGFSQTLLTSEDLIQARSLVWMLELTGQAVPPLLAKAARSWLDILERVDPEAYARLPMAERQCSRGFSRSSGPAPHWGLSRFDSQGSRDEAPPSASLTGSWEKYKPGRQMAAARTSARPVVRGQVERRLPGSCRRAVTAATANPSGTWDNYRPLMQPRRRLPANSLVPPEE